MKIFTVHCRPASLEPDQDLVLVKDGFSWPGFLFSVPWALWHGLWLLALVLLAAGLALEGALALAGADSATALASSLGYSLIVGFGANDWRRRALARRGYRMLGLVAAPDRETAARRYFDLNPGALGDFGPSGFGEVRA